MRFPNKRELQQTAFNHWSDINFHDLMNSYERCTTKPYTFLLIDASLTLDNSSNFKKNVLERIKKFNHYKWW